LTHWQWLAQLPRHHDLTGVHGKLLWTPLGQGHLYFLYEKGPFTHHRAVKEAKGPKAPEL
jgi:hypothetical protein